MRAGQLRHVVDVEAYTEVQDGTGQPIKTYALFSRRHARIRHLSGRELFAAQELFAAANVEITMRYFDGLVETMRIRHRDRLYNILNIDDTELRHIQYICLCQTGLVGEA